MKSINVDWSNENIFDRWEFTGANLIRDKEFERLGKVCKHGNKDGGSCDECQIYPDETADNNNPMMNYAYPLFSSNVSDEKILKVCKETNCTVLYNTDEDKYYLALTGGGMDLSQDIALAYMIIDDCIEWDMLEDVYISGPLSVGKDKYKKILKQLQKQLIIIKERSKLRLDEVNKYLKGKMNG
jgi:hypothetical protein